ncbi:MAG: DUF177 domain-containing protein [Prevotella sp.]|uniref:YceD family protein n=1 Tax=Prevotella sp. TaxID=59823 RepID=UPI002A30DE46|nr:DUF177 domain-containing protein [Prevotella sp.]MDD7319133.1 DUF177 domain-containing protein [Prevotellaceae bacterium]MDY4019592.1 DUF177 domain-containing protein [Prevotella sp.]
MNGLESLRIDLKSLQEGVNVFETDLDGAFFEALGGQEVSGGRLHVSLSIRKASGFFDLTSRISGFVSVACDLCLDEMEMPVDTENHIVVKYGSEEAAEDDVVTVAEDEGILDMSWLVYEFVTLAIPIRHVHAPGKCNPVMAQVLEELSSDRSSDEESGGAIDSRWSELLKLKD